MRVTGKAIGLAAQFPVPGIDVPVGIGR